MAVNNRCPECNGPLITDEEAGEQVCTVCGMVVDTLPPSLEPERIFPDKERTPRTGYPLNPSLHDFGLSTQITQDDHDFTGRPISPETKLQMWRLRRQQHKPQEGYDRSLRKALPLITTLCRKMGLPTLVEHTASMQFRQILKTGKLRGRSIEDMALSIVYMACRTCYIMRSINQFASLTGLSKKTIAKNYRVALKALNMKSPKVTIAPYVSNTIVRLGGDGDFEKIALEICSAYQKTLNSKGKGPTSQTAAIVYMASIITGKRINQGVIVKVANTTEVSLRNRMRELEKILMVEVKL